jgi:hypothetical protein
MTKTLLPILLIILLALSSCIGSNRQNPIVLATATASIVQRMTLTRVPSGTPTPTISITITPSQTPFPSPTLPNDCGRTILGKPGTQTKESNHSVLIEGTAILCNHGSLFEDYPTVVQLREAMLDLDSGTPTIKAADIGFGVDGTMNFYGISLINDALVSVWSLNGLTSEHAPNPPLISAKHWTLHIAMIMNLSMFA